MLNFLDRETIILFLIVFICNDCLSDSMDFNINKSDSTKSTNSTAVLTSIPQNCSQRERLKKQPQYDKNTRLKKCCPIGESLTQNKMNQNEVSCESSVYHIFKPTLLNVTIYDNCIEDMETEINLGIEIGNPCNTSFLYNSSSDLFFVIQDGSLLVMDINANDTFIFEKKYCIDIDNGTGISLAIVCITSVEEHLNRSQIMVVAILMLISIPCLFLVTYLHLIIKQLRSLHGITLSIMSACLATGYLLYSLVHIIELNENNIGYAVQFFILSYYFWYFCLCINVSLNIWLHILQNKKRSQRTALAYFIAYTTFSFFGASILVLLTIQKGLPGMPSYFIQGFTESIRESQRFFIPPVSAMLILSFFTMMCAFFGFQRIKAMGTLVASSEANDDCIENIRILEEIKKDAKCISLLGFILIATWLLEVVTFYSPGTQIYLILMDMINGLQGVFVLLIFLVVRNRRNLIFQWWKDRGSLKLDKIELSVLQ